MACAGREGTPVLTLSHRRNHRAIASPSRARARAKLAVVQTDAERIEFINAAFYRGEPDGHLFTRLCLLLAHASDPAAASRTLDAGVHVYGVRIQVPFEEPDPVEVEKYLTIEVVMLAQHAIETCLRLFLGHASGEKCPPMSIASLTSPSDFREKLDMILSEEHAGDLRIEVGNVLFGISSKDAPDAIATRDACVPMVRDLAEYWLRDAPLYNALKHGLAGAPGSAVMQLGLTPDEDTMTVIGSGTSIEFLRRGKLPDVGTVWQSATKWVDLHESMAAAAMAIQLIGNIWSIAKYRYANAPRPERLCFPKDARLRDFAKPTGMLRDLAFNQFQVMRKRA